MASPIDSSAHIAYDRPVIEPSSLGQFITLDGCPQFFKYEFDDELRNQRRSEKDWKEAFKPLSLALEAEGHEFERHVIETIAPYAHRLVDHADIDDWETSQSAIREELRAAQHLQPGATPVVITQPRLGLAIEAWPVAGDADLMVLWPTDDGGVRIRLLEIKASHEEKTYHQIQTATYTLLMRKFLNDLDPEFDWVLEAGVIHRGTTIGGHRPADFPEFPLTTREVDVRRLLQPGGRFDQLWARAPEDVRYQLAPKCLNCAYKESCFTDAIEHAKPALLGLSQGEQTTLATYGIETLSDLAELAYPPTDPRPYEYDALTPVDRSTYDHVLDEPGIGERLDRYIQRAQAVLGGLNGESMYTPETPAPFIVGSGNGDLPDDDPPFDVDLAIDRGTLLRCYIHVEWDSRRNRILMLSGHATATAADTAHEFSTITPTALGRDASTDAAEERVLDEFFTTCFTRLRALAADVGHGEEAPIHFYFYTRAEYAALRDAITRHNDLPILAAARDLFDLRGAIDQRMVSVIQTELRDRIALPFHNSGLLPVMEYIRPSTEGVVPASAWTYTRDDGTDINLKTAFNHNLFDYSVPYAGDTTGITLYPEDEHDGFYPSRARQGAQIPLEYIWAALGESPGDPSQRTEESVVGDAYKWVDPATKATRITTEDLKALGGRFARSIAHVERGIHYKNPYIQKIPIDVETITEFSLGATSIARACTEYLHLEYTAQRTELLRHYSLPVKQRIRRGESIPLVVTETRTTARGDLEIEGRLLYDQMFDDGERVAGACRQKGARGATGGSWMVANELTRQGEPKRHDRPRAIERGVGVTIDELDIPARRIRLTAIRGGPQQDREFTRWHRRWTTTPADADDSTVCIAPNRVFVLDPRSDDLTAQRAYDVLQQSENNFVCQVLSGLATGGTSAPRTTAFPDGPVSAFTDWVTTATEAPPNEQQLAFIEETTAQFALLQGPPGTGKTSGALAPAVLARILAAAGSNRQLTGIATGESNKAVDELLADVAALYSAYQADPTTDSAVLDEVRLIRLTSTKPPEPHDAVEYVDYHTDRAAMRSIASQLLDATPGGQQSLEGAGTARPGLPHIVLFGTPSRIYGFINQLDCQLDETLTPQDWLRRDQAFFDLLAVDEASMVRLPSFLLAGAFLTGDAQVLIAGDHRQLPPVQHHAWPEEDRRPVTALAPYLSALDYFRVLNGHDHPAVDPDASLIRGTAECPLYQLERTYRCHEAVTRVLRRYVYAKDAIPFRSHETAALEASLEQEPVATILDPTRPLVVVLHREQASQQSNPTEAALCERIVSSIPTGYSTGIVTPHNAQRGLLTSMLGDAVEVDTVERYQGGERDCVLVSATASDPDYLSAEQEFILNPNRLNVAMSRMKRKLIVVASEAVFDLVPPDVTEYERAQLWKGLYRDVAILDRAPAWTGTVGDFTTPHAPSQDLAAIPVSVYAPTYPSTLDRDR